MLLFLIFILSVFVFLLFKQRTDTSHNDVNLFFMNRILCKYLLLLLSFCCIVDIAAEDGDIDT